MTSIPLDFFMNNEELLKRHELAIPTNEMYRFFPPREVMSCLYFFKSVKPESLFSLSTFSWYVIMQIFAVSSRSWKSDSELQLRG